MTKHTKLKWPITESRHVAYVELPNLLRRVHWKSGKGKVVVAGIMALLEDLEISQLPQEDDGSDLNPSVMLKGVLLLDTIVIVTRDLSEASTLHFVGSMMRLQIALLNLGLSIRGGLAKGMITADFKRNQFWGSAFNDAREICQSLLFFGLAEKSEDQSLAALDDYRKIIPGTVPLYFPKFAPTTNGSTLLFILNIAMAVKTADEVNDMFDRLAPRIAKQDQKIFNDTKSIFQQAFHFTFPNHES